jgi:thymidylate synthase
MAIIDKSYNALMREVLNKGKWYNNEKRGVKRLQIPSAIIRHEMNNGFPIISTKQIELKQIVAELLWFLRGDSDIKFLNENGTKIWNKDAYNWYKKNRKFWQKELSFKEFQERGTGSVGRNYGVQWRDFKGTDQITDLINNMKRDIMSSQLLVVAWNPAELKKTALPPCHTDFQIVGVPLESGEFGFELHWKQRSVDLFLGLPYNITSYSLLGYILQSFTGYKFLAVQGDLKCVHFYDNQIEAAEEQLQRSDRLNTEWQTGISMPFLQKNEFKRVIDFLKVSDFELKNYESFPKILVKMLAPKEI